MITISEKIYQDIANELLEQIGDKAFFNGKIECDTEEFCSYLRITLVVHRKRSDEPRIQPICDLVPVWWEYHMIQENGEVDCDFSWSELKNYLQQSFSDRE